MPLNTFLYKYFFALLFVLPSLVLAQTFRYTQYNTLNGLPVDNIYAAAQDGNGFMWFANNFGIAKFNGHGFINFGKGNGIRNLAVTDIVYAGGDSLIFISYPSTIQSIHYDGRVNTLVEAPEFSFHQIVKHGAEFYGYHRTNSNYMAMKNGSWRMYNADSVLGAKNIKIHTIFSLNERGVAFCTSNGFYIKNGNTVTHLLNHQNVQIGLLTKKNNLLLVSNNRIIETDSQLVFKKSSLQLPPGFLTYQIAEQNGDIWFRNIEHGVIRLQNNKLKEMSELLDIKGKTVNKFFTDRDGNFWICTDGNGILLKKKSSFDVFDTNDGLPNNKVLCLHSQNNVLYIGTENGIATKEHNLIKKLLLPAAKEGLKYTFQIQKANQQQTGLTIAHTFIFNSPGAPHFFTNFNSRIKGYFSMFAWQQDDNNLWTCDVTSPPTIFKITGDKFSDSVDISPYKIKKIYKMMNWGGFYWVGTDKGLFRFKEEKKYAPGLQLKIKVQPMFPGQVFDLLADKKGRLWVATESGLHFYKDDFFIAIPKSATMGGNYCSAITMDDSEKIWVSTWDGLFVTDGSTKTYFSINNGLPSKTVNTVFFDTATQQLYVGTDNGLAVLNKNSLENNNRRFNIYLSCRLADENLGNSPVKDGDDLTPSQNSLEFDLSIPYYQDNENIKFEYKLDNGPWMVSSNPKVTISNTNSGKHVFLVKASLNGSLLTNSDAVFTFTIKKTFYKTWWFLLVAAVLIQLLIIWAINKYNKIIRERKLAAQQQQAEFASLKQQAFTSLMNPHFIFNALNSIQHYINKQDRQTANKYLSDFATLVRRSFDSAQKAFVPLDEELETVRLYLQLEKMRFTDKFNYQIEVSKEAEEEEWMLPGMVLQPFLENAILHGLAPLSENGQLNINISATANTLYITITDNGIGMQKSSLLQKGKKHNSRGMQLIKERLQILSKFNAHPIQLNITELNPGNVYPGTCIQLVIPQQVYETYMQSTATKLR